MFPKAPCPRTNDQLPLLAEISTVTGTVNIPFRFFGRLPRYILWARAARQLSDKLHNATGRKMGVDWGKCSTALQNGNLGQFTMRIWQEKYY